MINNFNLDYWPIVYFKGNASSSVMTDELFEEYKKYYLNLLVKCKRNNEQIVLICDMNNIKDIQMKYVMKQSQFNKEIYKFNKAYVKGVCILCDDKNFKNILNLYFTVSKPATPYKLCRSISKANAYINETLNTNFDISIFFKETEAEEVEEGDDSEDSEDKETTLTNQFDNLFLDSNEIDKNHELNIDLEKYNSTPFL